MTTEKATKSTSLTQRIPSSIEVNGATLISVTHMMRQIGFAGSYVGSSTPREFLDSAKIPVAAAMPMGLATPCL